MDYPTKEAIDKLDVDEEFQAKKHKYKFTDRKIKGNQ